MEPPETIAFVRRYNAWRRNEDDSEMPHPKDIGHAIDALCDHAERMDAELAAERALADRLAGLLGNCRDDSCELLGERGWWKDEPRCDYSKRYEETAENIAMADEALAAWKEARK